MAHRILHLSDTHATASGLDMDGADAIGALDRLLHDCRHLTDLDAVVVSGDIADDGSLAGCEAVRDRVGAYAAGRGIPHRYCPGNHDDRASFAATFGAGPLADRCVGTIEVSGLRIVMLDSLVPGSTHGELGAEQLSWLTGVLATRAPAGTVVVLHHPPVFVPQHPRMRSVVLQDVEALAEALQGSDVRGILAGHLHLQLSGTLAGIPVWVTPGVVSRIDLTAAPPYDRGVVGASATVVDLGPSRTFMTHLLHARQPDTGRLLYLYDPVAEELLDPATDA